MPDIPESVYLEMLQKVQHEAGGIVAICMAAQKHATGPAAFMIENAGKKALALSDLAADARMSRQMATEASSPGRFDLGALAGLPMTAPESKE